MNDLINSITKGLDYNKEAYNELIARAYGAITEEVYKDIAQYEEAVKSTF